MRDAIPINAPKRLTAMAILGALVSLTTTSLAQQPPPPPGFQQQPQPQPMPGQPPGAPPGPPGYYPPPPGYPYGYAVPAEAMLGPKTMDYDDGDPVPAGYHVDTKLRKGLLIGGAVTFGAMYLFSAVSASTLNSGNCTDTFSESGGFTQSCPDHYTALYVPVVGPFITIGTAQSSGGGTAILILDGVVQAGSLTMAIMGLALRQQELVRNDIGAFHVVPIAAPGLAGFGIAGTL